ncbi:uncharacterized protein NECHADRAFT_85082 [Fusarium vanettenii 77-13-4]|uniref:Uncharacterized protein n=1 Tax=Fusarium vanettenii (strain ATCC MYA-4622 / CBS 123669 / FGSC 9596 / NRRL 45880 / 77-13-4) TaxID=660122 RepID=C7YUY3_FUSV7|nr:uncharacterized protein NECHADRAFT_85082 [Fusarium vanettenii 77-13-4]EEU44889.1 predicted protein [Fusarium vanettenii 77-13-4]
MIEDGQMPVSGTRDQVLSPSPDSLAMNSISVAQLKASRSTTNDNNEALLRLHIPLAEHQQQKKRSDKAAETKTPAAAAAAAALMRRDHRLVHVALSGSLPAPASAPGKGTSVDTDLGDPAQGSAPSVEPTKKTDSMNEWLLVSESAGSSMLHPLETPSISLKNTVGLVSDKRASASRRGLELHSSSVRARTSICHLPMPSILSDPASPQNLRGRHPGQSSE